LPPEEHESANLSVPDLPAKAYAFFKFGAQEGDGYWNNKLLIHQLKLQ